MNSQRLELFSTFCQNVGFAGFGLLRFSTAASAITIENDDISRTNVEIDVVEWYGGDWLGHHHTVHLGDGATRKFWGDYEKSPVDLSLDWHTHGALITDDWIIVYLDQIEIARFPMLDQLRTELYPQLTLSILKQPGVGEVSPEAISPMDLQVDYVRVYAPTGR